jgi:uncharacterized membrane protein YtjA (UPF0391 family)
LRPFGHDFSPAITALSRAEPLFPGPIISRRVSVRGAGAAVENRAESVMLGWVITFLIIALIAGVLGFGGVAGASIEIAKTIFFIAVVLFIVSAVIGVARGRNRV